MILTLKDGFLDYADPNKTHFKIDLCEPVRRTPESKRAFRSFKDLIAGIDSAAQLNTVKMISGIDFSGIESKKEEKEASIEKKAKSFLSRGACVNKNISNELVDSFFSMLKTEPSLLKVNDRNLTDAEVTSISADDETLIASCYAVAFMMS
jgi:hypothetical protein